MNFVLKKSPKIFAGLTAVFLLGLSIVFAGCGVRFFDDDAVQTSTLGPLFFDFSPQVVSMTRASPAISITASADGTPILSGTLDRVGSISFYSDSSCRTSYGTVMTDQYKNFSFSKIQFTVDGTYTIYYRTYDTVRRIWGGCENANLGYRFQALPIVQFSQPFYSKKVAGAQWGNVVRVSRDVGGVAFNIDLEETGVTAVDGTNITLPNAAVSFSASDTDLYQDVVYPTSIAVGWTVDRYMVYAIPKSSAEYALGDNQIAQLNILSETDADQFFFPHSLFTAKDSSSSFSLTVQRFATGSPETVDISFVDGSAVSGTDYGGTTLTASFGANDTDATVNIPIYNVSANKSFYAKIVVKSSSTVRQQAVAKIRILDTQEINNCDASITATMGGGTGIQTDPYLICNVEQLALLSHGKIMAYYKLMADVDNLSGSFEAFTSIEDGFFDGNERVLSRFRRSAGGGEGGVLTDYIKNATSGSTSLTGVNLLYADLSNADKNSGLLVGLNGGAGGFPSSVTHCHTSGVIQVAMGPSAGMIGHTESDPNGVLVYSHLLSAGVLESTAAGPNLGGLLGSVHFSDIVDFTLTHAFNTAALYGATDLGNGGIAGNIYSRDAGSTFSISNLENHGLITGHKKVGGVMGVVDTDSPMAMSGLINTGNIVNDEKTSGGAIAVLNSTNSFSLTNSTNYGNIGAGSNFDLSGGLVGGLTSSGTDLTISQNSNYAQIIGANFSGGIVGGLDLDSTTTVNINGNSNIGHILPTDSRSGGIIGYLEFAASNAVTLNMNSNQNAGDISGAKDDIAGIVGYLGSAAGAAGNTVVMDQNVNSGGISNQLHQGGIVGYINLSGGFGEVTLSNATNSGAITSSTGRSGGIFGEAGVNANNIFTVSDATNSGAVSGDAIGGIGGYLIASLGAAVSITDSQSTSGTIASTTGAAGGLLGYVNISGAGSNFNVSSSFATNNVTVSQANSLGAGGLLGQVVVASGVSSTIEKVRANGNVTGSLSKYLGGLIGYYNCNDFTSDCTIQKAMATGAVTGDNQLGGLIGYIETILDGSIKVKHSVATGAVTGANFIGGLAGLTLESGTGAIDFFRSYSLSNLTGIANVSGIRNTAGGTASIINSFWRKDATYNTAIAADGNQLTDAQMQVQGSFTNFGFGSEWLMGIYPELMGMP